MTAPGEAWARWRVPVSYPLALVCLWFARPTLRSVAAAAAIAIAGLVVRGAAAGHLRKSEALARTGPYALTRNPLYLGSSFLALAFAVASRSWVDSAVLGAYFLTFYPVVMRREESELRAQYGRVFEEYAGSVPLFWPQLWKSRGPLGTNFSFAQYRRNREYQAAIGVAVLLAVLAARTVWWK